MNLLPTYEEVMQWLWDTTRHAIHIEYYLQRLQIGTSDPERPHDIVGVGNKFEWEAIRGFAMQYRGEDEYRKTYVQPALDFHRQQHHHQQWNQYYPNATPDAMRLGAVDSVCSLLEPRGYQGGCHTLDEISAIAEKNPIHKVAWMQLLVEQMRQVDALNLKTTFLDVNVHTLWKLSAVKLNITSESFDIVSGRLNETFQMLKLRGYEN